MEYIELQIMGYYRVWGYILHPHTPSPPSKPHPLLSLYLTASTASCPPKERKCELVSVDRDGLL